MSDIAIKVENLSKRFQIGTASRPAYHRLSEAIAGAPQFLWNACRGLVPGSSIASPDLETLVSDPSKFWALKDVSFEVKQGEVVGIIGRNGAGKSTLLKILSRITEPTSGRFGVRGRVASLLEVGTGFHPELTGRENIYVSGVTLGMTRTEIKKRFDEIVDFSGVEKFLDTPVKHYSSGMQVRLGFAVAAHLESEILIIDEVLAVGDAEFQEKCLGKIKDVAFESDKTVLLVSHNAASISALCNRAILLAGGKVHFLGDSQAAINEYLQRESATDFQTLGDRHDRRGTGIARVVDVRILSENNLQTTAIRCGDDLRLQLNIKASCRVNVDIAIGVNDATERRIAYLGSDIAGEELHLAIGENIVYIDVPRIALAPGRYSTTFFMQSKEGIVDWVINAFFIDILPGRFFASGRLPPEGQGMLLLDHHIHLLNSSTKHVE